VSAAADLLLVKAFKPKRHLMKSYNSILSSRYVPSP